MSSALAVREEVDDKLALLKNTIAKGLTNDEFELFAHVCKKQGLDPFMRQIYPVKRGQQMTIQTGIDGYRLIAERSGRYMPGKEATFAYDKDGRLLSATSYVKRMGPDGSWHEIASTAFYSEYVASGPTWQKMPHIMLAKCAETAALRRAFPAEMSGLYTNEEMDQADNAKTVQAAVDHISLEQAVKIEEMIGGDKEYRDRLLKHFAIDGFEKLPSSELQKLTQAIKRRNEILVQKEMANRAEVEVSQ